MRHIGGGVARWRRTHPPVEMYTTVHTGVEGVGSDASCSLCAVVILNLLPEARGDYLQKFHGRPARVETLSVHSTDPQRVVTKLSTLPSTGTSVLRICCVLSRGRVATKPVSPIHNF